MIAIDGAPLQPEPDKPAAAGRDVRVRRPGMRIGPFVFVPELLLTPGDDPWAARKGEPRIFALLWCTYLMVCALVTIFSVRFLGVPDADEYRGACVMMCVLGGVGASVLWAALRMCQAAPRRVMRAVVVDSLVVALPLQAVIWPMPMLTDWPPSVALAIGLVPAGWVMVTGALIAWGYRGGRRLLATGAVFGLVLLAPALLVLGGAPGSAQRPPLWGVLSPVTAPWALSWSPSGLTPRMSGAEWRMVTLAPVAGAVLLVLVGRWRPAGR